VYGEGSLLAVRLVGDEDGDVRLHD
jgi:hypothetical protein